MDREAAARAVAELLRALGHEPEGELAATPTLVAEAWCDELLDGEREDPAAILRAGAVPSTSSDRGGLVVLRGLAVSTVCPHHLLPAQGRGLVAYLPGTQMAGFGAVSRALRALTRRLTLQERAGIEMAECLVGALGVRGALCRLELVHSCLVSRGARETDATVETVAFAGSFADAGDDRALATSLLHREGR